MPCENAVTLAQDADLLIHEGTFESARSKWALETGHSTVTQAAEMAQKARVKQLILTHISARYDDKQAAALQAEARVVFPETIIAKDLMKIDV
jgi:ribonuclease Z